MKKRLTALALAASMLLVLPGCGAKTPQVPSVMPNRAEVVKANYPVQVQFPDAADYNDDWKSITSSGNSGGMTPASGAMARSGMILWPPS